MKRVSAVTSSLAATVACVGAFALTSPGFAADEVETTVSIKNHKFEPARVHIPAGKPVKLIVKNMDATAEEFESHPLKFEKVVAGGASATIRLQPLAKGTYTFFGEYHENSAQGVVVAE
jgi:plastocyanin